MERFDDICKEHVEEGRAKAFAFIFYKFNDGRINFWSLIWRRHIVPSGNRNLWANTADANFCGSLLAGTLQEGLERYAR